MQVAVWWSLAALVLGTTLQATTQDVSPEELPVEATQEVRSDPGQDAVAATCPASCFCEEEAEYATCVGDGQWAPPTLPSGLSRVELRSFLVPELEAEQLRRLPGLRELQLNQCNISRLVDDAFAAMPDLDRLDLSENRLTALGPASLRGLRALHHLDLSANLLANLTQAFTHLPALQHLNLRDNRLASLAKDTFQGLDRVQHVNLDSNRIVSVEVAAFQHLTSLAVLVLSNNPLTTLSTLDFFGSRLQYIDVSNIGITRVPQALTQFVRDLRLAKNSISEIHRGDLDSYPNLGLLVLDDNGLQLLEEDALGRHECLACLWLNGNRLTSIPLSLPPALKSLYVEENQIAALREGDFSGLVNLEQLLLQRNHIARIEPHAFRELVSLKTLDLQANQLANLTGRVFAALTSLDTLDLSQNPLLTLGADVLTGLSSVKVLQMSRIHSAAVAMPEVLFDPLKSLQILEMYGSPVLVRRLVNTTRMLHSLRGVRELNLMHNDLVALRPDFPDFFPKLQVAKLSGNAWRCDVPDQVLWMKTWMTHSPVHFYRSHSIRCSSPASLGYKPTRPFEMVNATEIRENVTEEEVVTEAVKVEVTEELKGIRDVTDDDEFDTAASRHHPPPVSASTGDLRDDFTVHTAPVTQPVTTEQSMQPVLILKQSSPVRIPVTGTSSRIASKPTEKPHTTTPTDSPPYWIIHNRMPPFHPLPTPQRAVHRSSPAVAPGVHPGETASEKTRLKAHKPRRKLVTKPPETRPKKHHSGRPAARPQGVMDHNKDLWVFRGAGKPWAESRPAAAPGSRESWARE
ncbi:hypothetical protein O3P69_009777 [Scylla paramamosain]|uniref:Uncharacterized protein n=1 Tax=Scylla paramamosain TaxID=85552 RepID=A0AAW0SMF3_SCYPA